MFYLHIFKILHKSWILFRFDAGVSNEWFNAAEEDRLYQETFPSFENKDIKIITFYFLV